MRQRSKVPGKSRTHRRDQKSSFSCLLGSFDRRVQTLDRPFRTEHSDYFKNAGAHGSAGQRDPNRLRKLAQLETVAREHALEGRLSLGLGKFPVKRRKFAGESAQGLGDL